MTEQEWWASTDLARLLQALQGKFPEGSPIDRKLRLFTCVCCRRIWHLFVDARSRKAVETAERYADGLASEEELNNALGAAAQAWRDFERDHPDRDDYADRAADCACWAAYYTDWPESGSREARKAVVWEQAQQAIDHRVAEAEEQRHQCSLLRDILGNPFSLVAINPAWLAWNGGTIPGLAQAVYDERLLPAGHLDPVRLAVLADALEEAGCSEASILNHCRQPGVHVRGCWLVDACRGQS